MVSYVFRPATEPPASKRWLARRFPHRHEVIAELCHRVRCAPDPIAACPPDAQHFGHAVERTLALDLCDTPPYPHLFASLPETARRSLLTTAGYRPTPTASEPSWRRTSRHVPGARLFTVGSLLTDLDQILRQLRTATPAEAQRALRVPLRHRDTFAIHAGAIHAARYAFQEFWVSYASGFRTALLGYGPVIAGPVLLDGLRIADLLAGETIVELKTGHLDEPRQFHDLIDQVLTYALLAPLSGYPVTAVVMYLARYHVLARYPVDAFAARLAGEPINLAEAGHRLAALIHAERPTAAAA